MDLAEVTQPERRPLVALPAFTGPLDLLLHLVRQEKVSIWDIPIARICEAFQKALRQMEELDLEIAGEFLLCSAWLLLIKSRLLLPRRSPAEADPRQELVERLLEFEKVRAAADALAGLEEVRRGMEPVRLAAMVAAGEPELDLEELDVIALAGAMRKLLDRHRQEHPAVLDLPPLRFTVRDKVIELYELIQRQRAFALLSHALTRPDREEGITLLVAALELVRLGTACAHQRRPFAEIFLTPTGKSLQMEALGDV
ncbi:MAG: segregation/condensation protein A [Acidobacteriota bacterium]